MSKPDNSNFSEPNKLSNISPNKDIEDLSKRLDYLEKNISTSKNQLEKLEKNLSTAELVQSFKLLVWKITDFEKKVEKKLCLKSPFFYTERCGYKLQGELKVSDSKCENFLQVTVNVVHGDFDDLLSWPFLFKVRVSLLKRGGENFKIYDLHRINPSIGCKETFTMENLDSSIFKKNNLIYNDSIYFRIEVF